MKILVLNSGSSSIKYKVYDSASLKEIYCGIKEEVKSHIDALSEVIVELKNENIINDIDDILGVGHRVVHGGDLYQAPALVNKEVINNIEGLSDLAPLHNPSNLAGIKAIENFSSKIKQVAVFDTSFHQTIPLKASLYPLPYEYYEKYGVKRYGFHGISHKYVASKAAEILGKNIDSLNLITLHLGNGDSITAVKNGKSIDTSMGFTPLEGLMMGTRVGDFDSAIFPYLEEKLGCDNATLNNIINKQSGFKGICKSSDLREVISHANDGDELSKLAIEMFVYRIVKYVGSYMMVLGDVDAIVFTGGIGENSNLIRDKVTEYTDKFNLKSIVIKTNEELAIAQKVKSIIQKD
jgi:acetate kinase